MPSSTGCCFPKITNTQPSSLSSSSRPKGRSPLFETTTTTTTTVSGKQPARAHSLLEYGFIRPSSSSSKRTRTLPGGASCRILSFNKVILFIPTINRQVDACRHISTHSSSRVSSSQTKSSQASQPARVFDVKFLWRKMIDVSHRR